MANKERYSVFSIRKFKVGVASALIASGFFIAVGQPATVLADENPTTEMTQAAGESSPTEMTQPATNPAPTTTEMVQPAENTGTTNTETMTQPATTPAEEQPQVVAQPTTPEEVKTAVAENIKEDTEIPAAYLEKANTDGSGPFLAGVNGVIPFEAFGGDGMLTRALLKESKDAPWSDNGSAKNPALLPLESLTKNSYFYEVALDGPAAGKTGQELIDTLKSTGTHTYKAAVKVYAEKGGMPDLTSQVTERSINVTVNGLTPVADVKKAVEENIKTETAIAAAYLEKANADGSGPFLAGVNGTIPFEFFGGDGMLTRLLLEASKDAPWSDNGSAMNPAILPLDSLTNGQYFYQVALDGPAAGKTGEELIKALKDAGTHTYTATVNVYGNKDGKADESNIVATRQVKVNVNGITAATDVYNALNENIKAETNVPAAYLEKANADGSGPFLAGVNGTIPFEFFGGDGMLTRLLLEASKDAPWSDNGSAMNKAILPLDSLTNGQYFYQVALDGPAAGKTGEELIKALKDAGTHTYTATVNVFGNKDGKADESNIVATRQVKVNVNGITAATDVYNALNENIKAETNVPAAYLEKANADGSGPFLAGVNGTIPFEFFGGDGMLTRLLLEASKDAPWSDNGSAMNKAILPLDSLTNGQYFYQVALDGPAAGKTGEELIKALKDAGTHTYTATVNVFGNKDGKADESNIVATRQVKVTLNGITAATDVYNALNENIKAETNVPAAYLEKANADGSGPFLAGVNGTIPFEFFGGDGMLTRLLLEASKDAPWSDNGSAMNPAILPLDSLTNGQYFYQVALDGPAAGKTGEELIKALKDAGTHTYTATVNVFGNKDGKADESNIVATRQVKVTLNGITAATDVYNALNENIKAKTEVPADFLKNANVDGSGPFLAGVNGVIPFEFFGGDGMLTRLLLKASNGAPWSDNGTAMNKAILPLDSLTNGQYFYQVELDGPAAGKTGKDLLDILKSGSHVFKATVKVYGNKDGKADLMNIVAQREVYVEVPTLKPATKPTSTTKPDHKPMTDPKAPVHHQNQMPQHRPSMVTPAKEVKAQATATAKKPAAMMQDKMMKKELPKTGAESSAALSLLGMTLSAFAGLGLRKKSKK
ncbi:fibronectin-binding SSURE repeat-containing protein [Streptococcus pneumoniae]